MGCCNSETKENNSESRKFTLKDEKKYLKQDLSIFKRYEKFNKFEEFLKENKNFEKYIRSNCIKDISILKEIIIKFDLEKKIIDNFCLIDKFYYSLQNFYANEFILTKLLFKEYDVIFYIDKFISFVNLSEEENNKIKSLIKLYTLFFKKEKRGIIYNINSNEIMDIELINNNLVNSLIFNRLDLINLYFCQNLANEKFIKSINHVINGLKNLKTLIINIDNSVIIDYCYFLSQIMISNNSIVYFILKFSNYEEINIDLFKIIMSFISKDRLYAIYFSKAIFEKKILWELLNLLPKLSKLKFFGINTKSLDSFDFIKVTESFLLTNSLYIGFFSANTLILDDKEKEIEKIKVKILANKNLKVFHITENFCL